MENIYQTPDDLFVMDSSIMAIWQSIKFHCVTLTISHTLHTILQITMIRISLLLVVKPWIDCIDFSDWNHWYTVQAITSIFPFKWKKAANFCLALCWIAKKTVSKKKYYFKLYAYTTIEFIILHEFISLY